MIPLNAAKTAGVSHAMCGRYLDFFNDNSASRRRKRGKPPLSGARPEWRSAARYRGRPARDVRLGPEPAGKPGRDPDLAAFRFDGKVYFGSAEQVIQNSKVVSHSPKSRP